MQRLRWCGSSQQQAAARPAQQGKGVEEASMLQQHMQRLVHGHGGIKMVHAWQQEPSGSSSGKPLGAVALLQSDVAAWPAAERSLTVSAAA